ncbi:MAG: coenzyme F420-0:L-glutamate ligase [Chloroflexi bacterium]|nr:coenzyme F420-0:L-glutamate ligase [Chloroflexota bacterium]
MRDVQLIGVPGLPLIETGDDLASVVLDALDRAQLKLEPGDVVIVTSKIVSKAEGRWVSLDAITPDEEAKRVAEVTGKDAREIALILSESVRISRMRQGVIIVENHLGLTGANAGIDHSNLRADGDWRLLLPKDPDSTARQIRKALERGGVSPLGIIISDSMGRPFRMGTVGIAIGVAGLPALWDLRGSPDLFGEPLQATDVGFADEIAAAAGLVMGQAAEGVPVVIVRGLTYPPVDSTTARDLVRPAELDLYR